MSHLSESFVLGSDIGTSSCKTVLLDHRGSIVASASQAYLSRRSYKGSAEHDPDLESQSHYIKNYEIIRELNRSMRQTTKLHESLTGQVNRA